MFALTFNFTRCALHNPQLPRVNLSDYSQQKKREKLAAVDSDSHIPLQPPRVSICLTAKSRSFFK